MATNQTAKNGQAIIRASKPGVKLRAHPDGGMPTLYGHFAVFNRWAEIDSWMEGRFLERIAPGAFKKTFQETTPKVLFQHGMDPQIGDKPLGPVEVLEEDKTGAAYEVQLLDTTYVRDLIPGLEMGLYGASFRFEVMKQVIDERPDRSDENPQGLPERTIREAKVMEFGPVTFPAYDDATAGVRSLTDRFLFDAIDRNPQRARELFRELRMDVEDLDVLAQMIALGADYIEEQDEPADQVNIPKMEAILMSLAALVPYETQEAEPLEDDEDDDRAGRSKRLPHSPNASAATRTGGTLGAERRDPVKTWPHVSQDEWEALGNGPT